jgi:hypothetical protein
MQTIDSTCPTVRTMSSRTSTTRLGSGATPCTRRPSRVPPRRSTRAFTAGQLARDEYVRAVIEARATGVWL